MTSFKDWLKWGWYADQIWTMVEMRLIWWPDFHLGSYEVDIVTSFEALWIWGWYSDDISTFVDMRLVTGQGKNVRILYQISTLVDMTFICWPYFNVPWYELDILTSFKRYFKWGWNADEISSMVQLRLFQREYFNQISTLLEMRLMISWPWNNLRIWKEYKHSLIGAWYSHLETRLAFQRNFL